MRRDRFYVSAWVLATVLFALFGAAALARTFAGEAARVAATKLLAADPSLLALRGVPDGASKGSLLVVEIAAYLALLVAFMNTMLAVRHVRADEEQGRTELIAATRAGRASSAVATLVHAALANVVLGAATALVLVLTGYGAAGSFTLGWALATCGSVFFGVGLVCAQIFQSTRAANGWSAAVIGIAFLLRAIGDAGATVAADGLHATSGVASWFSPIGWVQQAFAFGSNRLWPGLLALGLAAALVALAFVLQGLRDNAAGLVAPRHGRVDASPLLRGPAGLAWRLQRASIIGWGIGAIIGGAMSGALGNTLVEDVGDSPELGNAIRELSNGTDDLLQAFLGVMMALVGMVVVGAALQTVMRLRHEEAGGTAEIMLATPVGAVRWFVSFVVLALAASAVLLVGAGVAAGATLAQQGHTELFGESVVLALGQLPALTAYVAITAAVFALAPRATVAVGWTLLGVGFVVGSFGGLFGLPQWVRDLVPGAHVPSAPLATADWSGAWVMSAASLAALAVAALLFRRRSLVTG